MLTQHSGFAAYLGWRGLYLDAPPFTIETCPPSGRRRLDPWGRREWGASIAALTFASLAQLLRHGRYAGGQECYAGFSL